MFAYVSKGYVNWAEQAGSCPTKRREPRNAESDVSQNTFVQVAIALDVEHWTRPHLRLTSFFALHPQTKHLIVSSELCQYIGWYSAHTDICGKPDPGFP